jgi:hypothetical protein
MPTRVLCIHSPLVVSPSGGVAPPYGVVVVVLGITRQKTGGPIPFLTGRILSHPQVWTPTLCERKVPPHFREFPCPYPIAAHHHLNEAVLPNIHEGISATCRSSATP